MTELERDVLQESFDPPPEHGPYVNDADEQRMREVAQKEIDDQLMVPGVDHYVQMIQEEKGISGTSSIKMPAGVLTGEKPFNMKKDTLISNWYPGIPARDVVYEKFVSDFTYQFDRDSVKKKVEQLQKVGGQCMQLSVETDKSVGVVTVNVVVSKVGTKTAKCLFDTGANVSLISEEWIARSGYRVDGDDSKVIAARRVNRFDGALVKADSPLTFTVFGGGKFSVTHYIVLKTCACRGSGTKYNQLTTSCGYVTYWVTPWLKNDVPLLIGRD
ncbi:hypothetical protein ADUPG1_004857, partial [Aduncisulcus paluster]